MSYNYNRAEFGHTLASQSQARRLWIDEVEVSTIPFGETEALPVLFPVIGPQGVVAFKQGGDDKDGTLWVVGQWGHPQPNGPTWGNWPCMWDADGHLYVVRDGHGRAEKLTADAISTGWQKDPAGAWTPTAEAVWVPCAVAPEGFLEVRESGQLVMGNDPDRGRIYELADGRRVILQLSTERDGIRVGQTDAPTDTGQMVGAVGRATGGTRGEDGIVRGATVELVQRINTEHPPTRTLYKGREVYGISGTDAPAPWSAWTIEAYPATQHEPPVPPVEPKPEPKPEPPPVPPVEPPKPQEPPAAPPKAEPKADSLDDLVDRFTKDLAALIMKQARQQLRDRLRDQLGKVAL